MAEKRTIVHRSLEERLSEIDSKILYHKKCIKTLEEKKQGVIASANHPKRQRQFRRLVSDGAISPELLRERFNISEEEFEKFLTEIRETSK